MEFNVIIACDSNLGIGFKGKMPWSKIKEDLAYFKKLTENNVVIMGRKTWESLGHHGLSNRINIVISTTLKNTNNVKVFNNIDPAINFCKSLHSKKIFIIGGNQILTQVLNLYKIDNLYLTSINGIFDCDVYFTALSDKKFKLVDFSPEKRDPNNGIQYRFLHFIERDKEVCGESQYLSLINRIVDNGDLRTTRNGKTLSVFGAKLEFSLKGGEFPLMTCKRVPLRWVFEELMWMIRGDTNSKNLESKGVNIWRANSSRGFLDLIGLPNLPEGELGPTYGYLMRNFGGDQLTKLIENIKRDPNSRRLILSLWNPEYIDKCALPPCVRDYQFYVGGDGLLSCMANIRSSDTPVALHWNICSIALLTKLIATVCGIDTDKLIINIGDAHIYQQHLNTVCDKMTYRTPRTIPHLYIKNKKENIEEFIFDDLEVIGYFPYKEPIKLDMVA